MFALNAQDSRSLHTELSARSEACIDIIEVPDTIPRFPMSFRNSISPSHVLEHFLHYRIQISVDAEPRSTPHSRYNTNIGHGDLIAVRVIHWCWYRQLLTFRKAIVHEPLCPLYVGAILRSDLLQYALVCYRLHIA